MNLSLEEQAAQIEAARRCIVAHPLYEAIKSLEDVRTFMSFHIYAVWDFMSLLKCLQNALTCTRVPWMPTGDAETRYLINEIVTGEESDIDQNGERTSHYEMYLTAMRRVGIDTDDIENFFSALAVSGNVRRTVASSNQPQVIKDFLDFTFRTIESGKPHVQSAVFTYGREDLIPEMFRALIGDLEKSFPGKLDAFEYYLNRHIEIDSGEHSRMARRMTEKLCGEDAGKRFEAQAAIVESLEMRRHLWDGILEAVRAANESNEPTFSAAAA